MTATERPSQSPTPVLLGASASRGRPVVSGPFATATVLYLAMVTQFTLGSVPWGAVTNEAANGILSLSAWADPATWTSGSPVEFTANVLMFVPIGALIRLALPRISAVATIVFALMVTAAIEVAQIPLDRVSDPRDLLANGIGAVVGALMGAAVVAALWPAQQG